MPTEKSEKIEMLRHALATLAYRGGKAIRGVPQSFGDFEPGGSVRTPLRILTHIGDLLEWGLSIAKGQQKWRDAEPESWDRQVRRFHERLEALDEYLASGEGLAASPEQLFQGPVADALTHVGQIAMLRRLAETPIRGENYFVADIAKGRMGPEQSAPRKEFD